jgi:3',5'-cyclic-AMP phosphodiesterase
VPFTVVQLTDPHLGATWSQDPAGALAAAIGAVERVLPAAPDAVIVTGDLANTPSEAEYEQARVQLARLSAPVYALPGNHDDRAMLRGHFDLPPTAAPTLSYVADLGSMRLVALDSQRPGEGGGQIDLARLEWLDRELGEDPSTPTLLAMHHPPLVTGLPGMDAIGIPEPDRLALAEIVTRHRQVQLIAAGHVHRTLVGQLGATPVVAVASTDAQLALDFVDEELRFLDEPPCFAVHVLVDGRLVTHIQPV